MSSMMPLRGRQEDSEFEEVRRRLSELREGEESGPRYWRSLDELAQTDEFRAYVDHEFPEQADVWDDGTSRRQFLRLMAASLALAGVTGCGPGPAEKILPYVEQPERIVPGKPLFFATAHVKDGVAEGVLVESHMGRPIKVEGNPTHPASLGATDIFAQASVLTLYDPDRSKVMLYGGQIETWGNFLDQLSLELEFQRPKQGRGLRILTETVTSPSLAALMERVLDAYPEARWHQWSPTHVDDGYRAARSAFGREVSQRYDLGAADVIVSIDGDFLTTGPGNLVYAREFARRRRVDPENPQQAMMPRFYMVETTPTLTGGMADHQKRMKPDEVEAFAYELARRLGVAVDGWPGATEAAVDEAWITAVVDDLRNYRLPGGEGGPLVVAGEHQPAHVQALVHAMNERLGAVGRTVVYAEPIEARPVDHVESLRDLIAAMNADEVDMLIVMGGNPAYNAPADFGFAEAVRKVGFRVHHNLYEDETSALCRWHVPATHLMETWGDARAYDGTVTMIQPLIAPLYGGISEYQMLAALLGQGGRTNYELVRGYWEEELRDGNFEKTWQRILHDGFIVGSEAPPVQVSVRRDFLTVPPAGEVRRGVAAGTAAAGGAAAGARSDGAEGDRAAAARAGGDGDAEAAANGTTPPSQQQPYGPSGQPVGEGWDVIFRPDPTVWDGFYANNAWLQELPKPLSKLTWDNAAFIAPPREGEAAVLNQEDMIEIEVNGRWVVAPVWYLPGHPREAVTLHLGYGRERAGRVGDGQGFNAYTVRTSDQPWRARSGQIRRTGEKYKLACTQNHFLMEGRHLVRQGTMQEYNEHPIDPHFMHPEGAHHAEMSLYPEYEYNGYKWGMAINLGTCTGCSACVIACQAENNIPVVGKQQVEMGREMHWLRIDRYYEGDLEAPRVLHQPLPCMHCEKAPCEPVCPVHATVHSDEGLNDMVYNRCIGTRYCSNNCPYKVRRFNYLQYTNVEEESLKLMRNPDVTVRPRGVMEKCTYCVQRINSARIEAEREGRTIRDGEIKTACQAVCPTQAIVFGDLNDDSAAVKHLQDLSINYALLEEVNTRPRTTYLAALHNPNPELGGEHHAKSDPAGGH